MTLMELAGALIQAAFNDGDSGAENFSAQVVGHRGEIERRYQAVVAEFGERAKAILDGRA